MSGSETDRHRFVNTSAFLTALIVAVLVTFFIGFSLYWNITNLKQEKINLATAEAKSFWNKDAALRRWASRHGGVYVKPTSRTPPNPFLAQLPHRDVTTTDGTKLTLMNGAYIMSQMTKEFDKTYGIKGSLTAKIQINPANKPDEWEFKALTLFESGVKEVVEETHISEKPFLRFMKPMFMTEGCVKCHGFLGFKDGDLRGGVSVSIPLTPYFEAAAKTSRGMWVTHTIVWLLALFSITLFTYFARSRQQERIKLLKKLEHDAVHDGLTNLPNRLLFTDRLEHAINRSTRESGYQFAVCFLDLDRFKNINDSYGHQVGDNLLIKVAERLSHVLRPADSVARIGGDEFTFLLDDIEGLREAVFISERILSSLTSPFVTDIGELYVNASIGVCLSNNVYSKAEDMLRDADIALYRAKDSGRGRVDIFNKDMHEKAKQVMQMENDLRFAIEKKQFEVYYQPVVDISKNCIYGYEALLRWKHPELGFISPEIFIPVAEDTGLINDIGSWVMKQACSSVRDWNLEFGNSHPFCLAVNLSGKQLVQTDIVENIKNILMDTRFNPKLLHCEVTETAVIINREKSGKVIDELQEMGIEISVDDFGKGYSSLTYLHEFDFDTLKIDKDFVQDMGEKGKGRQLVKTMMLLARDFEMNLIAEGVEESDQLNRLKAMGCKFIQGYYFSKPLPAGEIHKLLQQGCHKNADKMVISPESDIESIKAI